MPSPQDIDSVLEDWDYIPGEVNARRVTARDGRDLLQMRVDMGLLQMEIELRPDGTRPHGAETYFDYLVGEVVREGEEFELSQEQCTEADREFVQYYHRRLCWLSLREYGMAAKDADHSLAFMDFVREHSPDEEWILSHEQYRPFVLFHRVQASALAALDDDGPELAIAEINKGLDAFRDLFLQYDAEDQFENDELVVRLRDMRESVRKQFELGDTLDEQLAEAVKSENYELAAELRDKMHKKQVTGISTSGRSESMPQRSPHDDGGC